MNLVGWFNSSIGVAQFNNGGNYGDGSYAAATQVASRVQPKNQLVDNRADGQQVVSTHTIYTTVLVGMQDRIWLPGDSTSNVDLARYPLAVTTEEDKAGTVVFYKVLV